MTENPALRKTFLDMARERWSVRRFKQEQIIQSVIQRQRRRRQDESPECDNAKQAAKRHVEAIFDS